MGDSTVQDVQPEYVTLTEAEVELASEELGARIADLCHGQAVDVIVEALFRLLNRAPELKLAWTELLIREVKTPRVRQCDCPKCLGERRAQRAQA